MNTKLLTAREFEINDLNENETLTSKAKKKYNPILLHTNHSN